MTLRYEELIDNIFKNDYRNDISMHPRIHPKYYTWAEFITAINNKTSRINIDGEWWTIVFKKDEEKFFLLIDV